MPAPYRGEEVAAALMAMARRGEFPSGRIMVIADEETRSWFIQVEMPGGEARSLTFPFASAAGIYTPAEIASLVVRDSWPFG